MGIGVDTEGTYAMAASAGSRGKYLNRPALSSCNSIFIAYDTIETEPLIPKQRNFIFSQEV